LLSSLFSRTSMRPEPSQSPSSSFGEHITRRPSYPRPNGARNDHPEATACESW
jgi:hypothetical protein